MKTFLIVGIITLSSILIILIFFPLISLNSKAIPTDCFSFSPNRQSHYVTGCYMTKGIIFLNNPNVPSCLSIKPGGCISPELMFRNECGSALDINGWGRSDLGISVDLDDGFNLISGEINNRGFRVLVFVTGNLCR